MQKGDFTKCVSTLLLFNLKNFSLCEVYEKCRNKSQYTIYLRYDTTNEHVLKERPDGGHQIELRVIDNDLIRKRMFRVTFRPGDRNLRRQSLSYLSIWTTLKRVDPRYVFVELLNITKNYSIYSNFIRTKEIRTVWAKEGKGPGAQTKGDTLITKRLIKKIQSFVK